MKQLWLVNQLNGVMFYSQDISSNFMENICWENVSQISTTTNLDERSPKYGKPTSANANHRDILEGLFIYNVGNGWWNLSTMIVRCAQHSAKPSRFHFHAVWHALKYLYITRDNRIYFWRTELLMDLPEHDLPTDSVPCHSTLPENLVRPQHGPSTPHSYFDASWADCPT